MVSMVSSGTEACMSALRLPVASRGATSSSSSRGVITAMQTGFVKAGSGLATFDIQTVPGVTAGAAMDTLTAPYNDLDAVHDLAKKHAGEIAAIIIEPVAGNMGCIIPEPGFLEGLRELCDKEEFTHTR